MKDATADMAKNIDQQRKSRRSSDDDTALQLCYRKIGIPAVAAAARYQGGAKNPAYAPVAIRVEEQDSAT